MLFSFDSVRVEQVSRCIIDIDLPISILQPATEFSCCTYSSPGLTVPIGQEYNYSQIK